MRAASQRIRTSAKRHHGQFAYYMLGVLCLIPVVITVCILVVMTMKVPYRFYSGHSEDSCCEEYVALLSRIVNRTINPCKSIYDFTCDRYSFQAAPGALLDSPGIDSSWGYKPSNTIAGKLAYLYYRSCVTTAVRGEEMGARTAKTLLQFLNESTRSTERLIVEISLKYGIQFPVSFISENMYNVWHYPLPSRTFFNVYHIAITMHPVLATPRWTDAKRAYLRIRRDARRQINQALKYNVSEREVNEMASAFRFAPRRTYSASNLTGLHKLIPALTAAQWQDLLENITGANITGTVFVNSDLAHLKRFLEALLKPASQPKSVVFSLVEATFRLLLGAVQEKSRRDLRERYFAYCQKISSLNVGPLLVLDMMEKLNAGKLHDVMLRAHFQAITKSVAERARALVAPEDVDFVMKYLHSARLFLPSEMFRLDLSLPQLTNDFARNYLTMRTSRWTFFSIPMPDDFPRLEVVLSSLGWLPRFFKNVVLLPMKAYVAVNITPGLDDVVPLATLGMLMADAVWRSVWNVNWGAETKQRIWRHYTCVAREKRIQRRARFYFPKLSLDAVLDAARRENWNATMEFFSHRLQKTSRRQLFFLLTIFHYYCPAENHLSPAYRRSESNYLFPHCDDFREAFGCSSGPVGAEVSDC